MWDKIRHSGQQVFKGFHIGFVATMCLYGFEALPASHLWNIFIGGLILIPVSLLLFGAEKYLALKVKERSKGD